MTTAEGPLADYYAALERLKMKKGARINNDTVAMEAGRKKGTIKKGRDLYKELIADIEAAANQVVASDTGKQKLIAQQQRAEKYRDSADSLRTQLDAALARELSLLSELYDTKKALNRLTGANVIPLRPNK